MSGVGDGRSDEMGDEMSEALECNYAPHGGATVHVICDRPPTTLITVACVHEHFSTGGACERHALPMLSLLDSDVGAVCSICRRAGCLDCRVSVIGVQSLAVSS